MRPWDLMRYVLTSCVAAALLVSCGGSQSPIGASGTMQRASTHATRTRNTSYKIVYSFRGNPDGADPEASLLDVGGTLYGTTDSGGELKDGCAFTVTTSGNEKVLYSFTARSNGRDGAHPLAGLIDVKGTLYGTTESGGPYRKGTVFAVDTTGEEHVIHSFGGDPDGSFPVANLIDVKGTLYGTTGSGGTYGKGTVFAVDTTGEEHVIHSFSGSADGEEPQGNLIEVKGTLYGTTESGGALYGNTHGTVFSVTPKGSEHVLYAFGGSPDGAEPVAGLIDVKGTLYGTTKSGGAYCLSNGCGTVFSITPSGTEKVLYSFDGTDGNAPFAALVDANGTLYGTTLFGGTHNGGTVFSVTPSGTENVLYSFGSKKDGNHPDASLIDVDGTLYGTTLVGGAYGRGTVFALTP